MSLLGRDYGGSSDWNRHSYDKEEYCAEDERVHYFWYRIYTERVVYNSIPHNLKSNQNEFPH